MAQIEERPVIFGDEQNTFSLTPAFLHCVKIWRASGQVSDFDVVVFTQQLPYQPCLGAGKLQVHGSEWKVGYMSETD